MRNLALIAAAMLGLSASAAGAHKLISPNVRVEVARESFSAAPPIEWNRLRGRLGKYQERWTLDGDRLNLVTFFGGVPVGEPLFKEINKKTQPLPKVASGMLITDIPALFEATYRALGRTNQMSIDAQEPGTLDGRKGINFRYTYVFGEDEVERKGEAFGAVVNGKLYLVTYEAPSLYFFNKDVENFRALSRSVKIVK